MNLFEITQQKVANLGLQNQKILVAVSGGADSMVLLEVLAKIHPKCVVAHVNYQFRPEESEKEELLVRTRCAALSLPIFVLNLKGYEDLEQAEERNLQIFARQKRYAFFEQIMQREECAVVATAHHADDNVETLLINFIKGTGYKGLKVMPVLLGKIFRPFIDVSSEQLRRFAAEENITFLEDSSNQEDGYDRNYLRNKIIPEIEARFPDFRKNAFQNIQRFQEVGNFYEAHLQARKNIVIKQVKNAWYIDLDKLSKEKYQQDLAVMILQEFGFSARFLPTFQQLQTSKNAAKMSSGDTSMIKDKNKIYIVKEYLEQDIFHFQSIWNLIGKKLKIAGKVLQFDQVDAFSINYQELGVLHLQADRCQAPVTIRLNRPGDYFFPFGSKKKKKISRFLADKKISQDARRNVPLIFCGDQCMAIAGVEIDYRFAISKPEQPCIRVLCSDLE